METVKSLQMEPQLEQRFGDYLASYLAGRLQHAPARQHLQRRRQRARAAADARHPVRRRLAGDDATTSFTIGMLVAFQMFAGRLSQPMLRLVGPVAGVPAGRRSRCKRLGDIMDAPPSRMRSSPRASAGGQGRDRGRATSPSAIAEQPAVPLRELRPRARSPASCVALMGPSGCGKSTLAKLLQGFYQPERRQHHASTAATSATSRRTSCASTSASCRRRPCSSPARSTTTSSLANPHAGFEQVVQACKIAEIHDVIEKLPKGYQTEIGEHGVGPLRRPEAAHRHRARAAQAPARPDLRRGDEQPRRRRPRSSSRSTVNQLKGG